LGSALPLIAIYIYTKFDLNGNSSFKAICWTRYRDRQMDGQSGDYMLSSSGSIITKNCSNFLSIEFKKENIFRMQTFS